MSLQMLKLNLLTLETLSTPSELEVVKTVGRAAFIACHILAYVGILLSLNTKLVFYYVM